MAKSNKTAAVNPANKMMSLDKGKAGRIVLFRILIIILTDIIVATLFDFVKSDAAREYAFHINVHTPLKYVSAVILVLAAVYFVITLVKKIDTSAHYMTPAMAAAVAVYLFLTVIFYEQFRTTPFLFYTMTVIASVLFAVYYIYTILLYKK